LVSGGDLLLLRKYSTQAAYFGKWWAFIIVERVFDLGCLLW